MQRITPGEVDTMLQQHLRRRSDLGLWNALTAMIFEPRNPFANEFGRRPQRWFVLFLASSVAAVSAFAYFNLLN